MATGAPHEQPDRARGRKGPRSRARLASGALPLLFLVLASPPLLAQEGEVTGVVRDTDENPLTGATVTVEGTDLRTLTDAEGRFAMEGVPTGDITVVAQLLGFSDARETVSMGVGETVELTLVMGGEALGLEELVVTGQGAGVERRRLSTSVTSISGEDIAASPAPRLDQVLQASMPSVQVRIASGQPGATSHMQSRGPVSVNRSSTPVIYVDGVRVDNLNTQAELSLGGSTRTATSSIADIPMENIERIEYVPGGAATTMYGSDAADGVLQIFTHRGSAQPTQLTFESQLGLETANEDYFFFPETVDLLYQNGLSQQYRLSGRGGREDVTWSFSGSVQDREGFRVGNNASRTYEGRTGLSVALTEGVQYDASFSFGHNDLDRTRDGNLGNYTPLWLIEGGRILAHGFNHNLSEATDAELDELRDWLHRAEELQDYRIETSRFQMSHEARWEPTSDLSLRALGGLDYRFSNERAIQTNEFLVHTNVHPPGTTDRGSIQNYDRRFLGLTLETGAQHQYDRGALSVITNTGGQLFSTDDRQSSRIADNVRDGSRTVRGAGTTTADDVFREVVNYGVYLQQNWGLFDRYFLEVGLRADGNSAFGDEVGSQYYPKAGLVYDLGSEPFFRDSRVGDWISQMRLRGNYGVAGNFPPPYTRDRTVSFASYLGGQAVQFGNPGNPHLGPEKTHTLELSGDLEALNGRLSLQANWYDARTHDALFEAPLAPSTGEGLQLRNVGEIRNSGVELELEGEVLRTDRFNLRMNASYNTLDNEVVDAGGLPAFSIGGHSPGTIQSVVVEGQPVGVLRGNRATLDDDYNIVDVEPVAVLGSPLPDRHGTLGMNLTVGPNLRFNASADWQTGARNQSFNRQFRYLHGLDDPELPEPILELDRAPNWLSITNLFVEDTDYLKVRNVSVSYDLPGRFTPGMADDVELGFAVINPTGWWSSSFNPETDHSGAQGQDAATVGGFDYAVDPSPRSFIATVRVRF